MTDIQKAGIHEHIFNELDRAWNVLSQQLPKESLTDVETIFHQIAAHATGLNQLVNTATEGLDLQNGIINELRFQRDRLAQMLNTAHDDARKQTLKNLVSGISTQLDEVTPEQVQTFLDVMNGEYTGVVSTYDMISIEDMIQEICGIVAEEQEKLQQEAEEYHDND
jgi:septal ring factor EnvC (AmiA/AmiB activator)